MANKYDQELVHTLRRTVKYFGQINHRASLTEEDKRLLKTRFLEFVAIPRAEKLRQKHTARTHDYPAHD